MMRILLLLALVSMLSLPAIAKPPSAQVRRAITQVMRAGDVDGFAAALVQHGLTVNSVIQEHTLLHLAVDEGTPEMVEYLLDNDVEVNPTNQYGFTALDEAKALDKPEMVALLEQAGAVHGEGYLKGVPTRMRPCTVVDCHPAVSVSFEWNRRTGEEAHKSVSVSFTKSLF